MTLGFDCPFGCAVTASLFGDPIWLDSGQRATQWAIRHGAHHAVISGQGVDKAAADGLAAERARRWMATLSHPVEQPLKSDH